VAAGYPRQNSLDNISNTPSFIFPLGDSSTKLGSTNSRGLAFIKRLERNEKPREIGITRQPGGTRQTGRAIRRSREDR
jgi:hypothetical protein